MKEYKYQNKYGTETIIQNINKIILNITSRQYILCTYTCQNTNYIIINGQSQERMYNVFEP